MFSAVCLPKGQPRCFHPAKKEEKQMTNLTLEEKKELIRMALAAREKAYAP